MVRNYYYLVASLPDYLLDDSKSAVSFSAFVDDLTEQVHPADAALLRWLRLPFDNRNVVRQLDRPDREFDHRGNFSEQEIADSVRNADLFPAYLQEFLEARTAGRELVPGMVADDQLAWLFFDACAASGSSFIREWFAFECDLANVLAVYSVRDFSLLPIERAILRRTDTAETIARSSAPDLSVAGEFPWIEKIVAVRKADITTQQKQIDLLRWEMLDELTTFSYFSIEKLLAFCLKLLMVERWQKLDPAEGKKKLDALLDELVSSGAVPAAG